MPRPTCCAALAVIVLALPPPSPAGPQAGPPTEPLAGPQAGPFTDPLADQPADVADPELQRYALADTSELVDPSTSSRPHGEPRRPTRDPNLPWATPHVSSLPDDPTHRARLDEAIARFTRAGLLLPDLTVEFSAVDHVCDDHLGLFDRTTTPWRVVVCSELEFVLTHELAHAWAAANLDDAQRDAYLAHRDLRVWNDPDLHWRERGTEDAAFVMQQVLMTNHAREDWVVWKERASAYEQLTGRPPPQMMAVEPVTDASDDPATKRLRLVAGSTARLWR